MENTNHLRPINHKNIYLLTFFLFFGGLVVISGLYMTIPLMPVFEREFSVTPNQAAWAGSIFSLFFSLGCLFFGIISEKYGLKRVMVFGLVCLCIIAFLAGFSGNFYQLLFFRGLQGIASATFSPVALTYIGTMFPAAKRVTTIGMISTGFLLAGIIGQLISSFFEPMLNWRAVFYIFGFLYAITCLMIMLLPKDLNNQNQDILSVLKKFKIPFQKRPIVMIYCIAITILLSFVGMYTALGEYLTSHFGFDYQQVFLVRALGIVGILFSPFTGILTVKLGIYRVLNSGLLLSVIGLFSIRINENLIVTIVMSVVFVTGIALVVPTLIALAGQLGGADKGIVISMYTFILFVGASIGPIVSTFIMQVGNQTLPFIIYGCLMFAGLILSLFMSFQDLKLKRNG